MIYFRSFIITPRRPLRDGNQNTSLTEKAAQESNKETIHSSVTSMVQESIKESVVPEVFFLQEATIKETSFSSISVNESIRKQTIAFPGTSMVHDHPKEVMLGNIF